MEERIEEMQAMISVLQQQLSAALNAACAAQARVMVLERKLKELTDGKG